MRTITKALLLTMALGVTHAARADGDAGAAQDDTPPADLKVTDADTPDDSPLDTKSALDAPAVVPDPGNMGQLAPGGDAEP